MNMKNTPRGARRVGGALAGFALAFAALSFVAQHAPEARAQTPAGPAPANAQPRPAAGVGTSLSESAGVGSITGRVVGEGGEPLTQIAVTIWGRGPGARAQRTATTDEEGNFVVNNLAPGLYTVSAQAPGYVAEPDPPSGGFGRTLRPGDSATIRMTKGGVVTGTVTNLDGAPVAAVAIRVYRVRTLDGEPLSPGAFASFSVPTQTDDRGVYRVYGMTPGVYLVSAGGGFGPFSPYEGDSPTFYPSGTRDTAAEVTVRAGQETAGVDIRYREERGQRVSGAIQFPVDLRDANVGAGVQLTHAATGTPAASAFVSPREAEPLFQLEGVSDGEYEVRASVTTPDGATRTSAPQRVSVRGADVTGLKLSVAPLAALSGRLTIEPPAESLRAQALCKDRRPRLLPQEIMLLARREGREGEGASSRQSQFARSGSAPDETGAFALRNLEAGRYRLEARPLDENLYVRVMQLPAPAPSAAAANPARPRAKAPRPARPRATPNTAAVVRAEAGGAAPARPDTLTLNAGQQLSGAVVGVAFGAAYVAGRVVSAEGVTTPPARMRVYLVPAEAERADDVLRYAETLTADGAFVFKNVAPGRYLLAARTAPPAQPDAHDAPVFWSAAGRAALRREAEEARATADLQPCQRLTDFALTLPTAAAPQK